MAENELGEKTEQPTPRKLKEARNKGQVPKSQDLTATAGLITSVILLIVLGGGLTSDLAMMMRATLQGATPQGSINAPDVAVNALDWTLKQAALAVLPLLVILLVVGLVVQILQVGPLLTGEPLKPKLNKLNPVSGVKRIFGKKNLAKTGISVVKLLVVVSVSWVVIATQMDDVIALPRLGPAQAMLMALRLALLLSVFLLVVLLVIAIIDLIFQRWNHIQELKMTKQEVKDERKSHDGNPEVIKRRRKMAQEIAMQRIQSATPGADVIITNPTHFSVALKYDDGSMRAPRVVAKGVDMVALRIRHIARTHDVPIVERPPLARALYAGVEVGDEIPSRFYEAVAEVLAFVYRLEREAA